MEEEITPRLRRQLIALQENFSVAQLGYHTGLFSLNIILEGTFELGLVMMKHHPEVANEMLSALESLQSDTSSRDEVINIIVEGIHVDTNN